MGLLDTYAAMKEQAIVEGQEKTAEYEEVDERMEVLSKYAELADNLLTEEYGNNYAKDDVVKLAQLMINHDVEVEDQMQKVAELHEAGTIMAHAFREELNRG
jgi:hypothetical protein